MRAQASKLLLLPPLLAAMLLVGCGTAPKLAPQPSALPAPKPQPSGKVPVTGEPSVAPVLPPAGSGRGGYYQDDGPGDNPPPNLDQVPDAEVRNDPLSTRANRPYVVFGKTYTPITDNSPFTQIGVGSWYGKKFHGQRTSSGELYDMYKMTAAHPILPIPSYARLTNLVSGAQVIVRINDRGPFHANRAIDVSYTAALKLGLLGKGSHELQIERILPEEIDRMLATKAGVTTTTPARLASKPVAASSGLALSSQPLVLTPKAVQGSAPQEVQALMLSDRAPGSGAATAGASANGGAAAGSAAGAPEQAAQMAPVAAEAQGSDAAVKGGFYLQLGAFSRADNAEAARARLARVSGMGALEVAQGGSVFRIFCGPYANRQEAVQAMQALPSGLGLKPIVIQR
jgi:rare lipoprotein A